MNKIILEELLRKEYSTRKRVYKKHDSYFKGYGDGRLDMLIHLLELETNSIVSLKNCDEENITIVYHRK